MVRARVKPKLIRWVRENAGLSTADVAKKAGTSEAIVRRWEDGTLQPTVRELRLLGNVAKRPLAVFYLAEPPRDFTVLHDFRQLPGTPGGEQTPGLRLAVRMAHERRRVVLDLMAALGELAPSFPPQATVDEPVVDVARRLRDLLGISIRQQKKWRDGYAALNGWRQAIQRHGVLVFQAQGVDLSEMRGFSVAEEPMPVITINSKDASFGRVFTLIHELGHLLLRKGGLCDLMECGRRPEQDPVEVFCNRVAAETLVPREAFTESATFRHHKSGATWEKSEVRALSREFSVSREVVLRRLLTVGEISSEDYRSRRQLLTAEYEARTSGRTGFASPGISAVSSLGQAFVKLVFRSYYQEKITSRDVSEHLGIKLKHMAGVERRVMGANVMFR